MAAEPDLSQRLRITSCCDLSASNLEAVRSQWPEIRTYPSADALWAAEKPDFVDICTPPAVHLGMIREAAARDFQRAIDIDPALSNAHLHRGWVHHQLGDSRAAADLEAALRHATDDASRYLAHLFLGMVAEHGNGLDAALREFEAARAIGPYQTSFVALSRVETALGHAERARTIAAEFAQRAPTSEDPWWGYRLGGFSSGALGWLRQEARKP